MPGPLYFFQALVTVDLVHPRRAASNTILACMLVEPDRGEGAARVETNPRASTGLGPESASRQSRWFRHSRSLALTSWPGQRPVNKPRKTSSMPRYGAILLFFPLRIFEVEQFLID